MTKTIPATKARQQFFKLIEETDQPGAFTTITVDGVPRVVMMSAEDFEGWMETLEIMSDAELVRDIREAEKSIRKGERTYTHEEIKKELKLK